MGDIGDAWREEKAARAEEKKARTEGNVAELRASGLPFNITNAAACWSLRQRGKPRVDVYPGTGRWRDVDTGKTYRGGVTAFLRWYAKQ